MDDFEPAILRTAEELTGGVGLNGNPSSSFDLLWPTGDVGCGDVVE